MKKAENIEKKKFVPKRFNSVTLRLMSKFVSPACGLLFYICLVLSALCILTALIVMFVNVAPEDMMLPPFMHTVMENDRIAGYNIFVGNGIKMYALYGDVTLNDIKLVIYAGLLITIAILLVAAPVFRFLSKLLANVAKESPLALVNARYVSYIGLTLLIGNTAVLFVSRFYNYCLISTFIAGGENMSISLGINTSGFVIGLLILLFGSIYKYACETALKAISESMAEQALTGVVLNDRK